MNAVFPGGFLQLLLGLRISVVDQVKELRQRLVQVISVPDFVHILPDTVRDIAQTFQRIAGIIALRPDWCIAQFRPCFDKEKEQHPVHIAEAFQRQLASIDRIRLQIPALSCFHVVEDFISQKFDALTQRIFQVLRYAGCVALALLIQFVQKDLSVIRAERILMEQDSHRLQRGILQPGENLVQLELKISFLIPFVSINQGDLIDSDQEKKARRFRLSKQYFCRQLLSRYLAK